MTCADEEAFLKAFSHCELNKERSTLWSFPMGEGAIEFLRCRSLEESTITVGRISLWTQEQSTESKALQSLYRDMESYIKGAYTNRMTVTNTAMAGSTRSQRTVWTGPDAAKRAREKTLTLRQSLQGPVVFQVVSILEE